MKKKRSNVLVYILLNNKVSSEELENLNDEIKLKQSLYLTIWTTNKTTGKLYTYKIEFNIFQ
jgi:hypothetical protein